MNQVMKGALSLLLLSFSLSSWAACTTDAWTNVTGTAEAVEEASYYGDCGLKITMNGQSSTFENPAYVEDGSPQQEPKYAARWYMNTDNLQTLAEPSELIVLLGFDATGRAVFEVGYQNCTGQPTVFAKNGIADVTDNVTLKPGFNEITVFWDNSGSIKIRVAGVGESEATFPATGKLLDTVKFGAPTGTLKNYDGHVYYDSFASTRGIDPGPEVNVCSGTLVSLKDYTFDKNSPALCKSKKMELDNVLLKSDSNVSMQTEEFRVVGKFAVEHGASLSVNTKF